MYQLFIEKETSFAPDLEGEYNEIDDARAAAQKAKAEDPTIYYEIKETDGHVNNYGELIATVVERG
ncbi:hypothetical protein IJ707_05835 [bacterium]|nr:hypothetical protein [bacterium]